MIGSHKVGNNLIGSAPATEAILINVQIGQLIIKPARPIVDPDIGDMTISGFPFEVFSPRNIAEGRGLLSAEPVYLIDISLNSGADTLRFSDRDFSYLGTQYQTYIQEVRGLGDQVSSRDSKTLNSRVEIVFRNEAFRALDYLIQLGDSTPFEGADVTINELYILPDGNYTSAEVVFRGALENPRKIDRLTFSCQASSLEFHRARLTRPDRVTVNDFPNAFEDLGAVIPVVIGSGVQLAAKKVDWGARTTLVTALTKTSTSAVLSDASRFPTSGSFWINNEKVAYSGKSGDTLTGLTRGYDSTTATVHAAGSTIWEHQANYDSVISRHALEEVTTVYAEIQSELFRVTSGVSDLVSGGRHILRASDQIKVDSNQEDVAVANPTHRHITNQSLSQFSQNLPVTETGCAVTGSALSYITFPSTSDKVTANYEIYFDLDVAGDGCTGTVAKDIIVEIGGQRIYERDTDVVNINIPSPLKFAQGSPTDQLLVDLAHFNTFYGDASVKITILSASRVVYTAAGETQDETQDTVRVGDIVQTFLVDRFHVLCNGAEDLTGIYGGVGTVIERPDHVLRYLLMDVNGFLSTDINLPSFNTAGSSFASAVAGGYKLAFVQEFTRDANEILRDIATQVRSIITFTRGQWQLDFLPDSAPSAVKTISESELAGEGTQFIFSRGSILDIANSIIAGYNRNNDPLKGDTKWNSTYTAEDSSSITKYGTYPLELALWSIISQLTAEDVIDFKLNQLSEPGVLVEFPLFFENFDLVQGDVIDIDSDLFSGLSWIIEKWKRGPEASGKLTVMITARAL